MAKSIPCLLFLFCFSLTKPIIACTSILYSAPNAAVMVGRNMDLNTGWLDTIKTSLIVYPRGITRDGQTEINPKRWTSKYGSIVTAMYHDQLPADGMNDEGLAVQMQWFSIADYGIRDAKLPGLSVGIWVQFYLDNFKTVAEAVHFTRTQPLQMVPLFSPRDDASIPQHISIRDAGGDAAIIEYVDGKLRIYHDRSFTVFTNEPTYPEQLANLKRYRGMGGYKSLPGSLQPMDRFVRASYYLTRLPKPDSLQMEIAQIFSVLSSVSEPYEVTDNLTSNPIPTIWRVVADLTHRTYYFASSTQFNVIWLNLDRFDMKAGAPIMKLDVADRKGLVGDVSAAFTSL